MSFYCNNTILLKPNNSNKSQTNSHTPSQRIPKCIKLMTDGPVYDVFYHTTTRSEFMRCKHCSIDVQTKSLVLVYIACRKFRMATEMWRRRKAYPIQANPVFCIFVLSVISVHLSCLSVTLDCGQTVGRRKMKLSMPVGIGPGHIVFDGDCSSPPPPQKRHSSPIFDLCLLWPNGWMDQNAT